MFHYCHCWLVRNHKSPRYCFHQKCSQSIQDQFLLLVMVTNLIQPTRWSTCRPTCRPTYYRHTTNTQPTRRPTHNQRVDRHTTNTSANTQTTRRPTLHRCIGRRGCINNFEFCYWVPSLRRAQYNSFLGLLVHYGT